MVGLDDTGGSISKVDSNHGDPVDSKIDDKKSLLRNGDAVVSIDETGFGVSGDVSLETEKERDKMVNGSDGESQSGNGREQEFRTGDFVWGKNKSYSWWPGQIYDSSDASEIALKQSQDGRLLVAFLGDSSWSWCSPSHLVSFTENFSDKSVNSSSKTFSRAVQVAVDEVGRVMESKMTCNCVSLDKRDGLVRQTISNSGVKPGVVVPNVDIHRLSIPDYTATDILAKVITFARTISVDSSLELAVLRGWLAALFNAKGGRQLPVHHDYDIEGLEDMDGTGAEVTDDFSVPIEVPILGPSEDDWHSPPEVNNVKTQEPTTDRIYHRRKQKSVADLMKESSHVNAKSQKKAPVKGRKDPKKSSSVDRMSGGGEAKEGHSDRVSSRGTSGNKRKLDDFESSGVISETEASETGNGTLRIEVGVRGSSFSGKQSEISAASAENDSGKAKDEFGISFTPRERKKSKYLSPPYISPKWRIGSSSSFMLESESGKSPKIVEQNQDEHESKASETPSASHENFVVNDLSNEKQGSDEIRLSPKPEADDEKMSFSTPDVTTPTNEVLFGVQNAAIDPLYLSKEGILDVVFAFISAFRSSIYEHGADNRIYQQQKTGKKRLGSQEDDKHSAKRSKLASVKSPRASQKERKPEKTAETSHGVTEGHTSLNLSFAPRTPLPSTEEIVEMFSKYGSLNIEETKVIKDSHMVQVVYNKESDAQTAFKSTLSDRPFGENVDYRLQPCSKKATSAESAHENSNEDFMSDVQLIRQKFDIMGAILENYHSKFSTAEKCSLKDEMKRLMESIETASDKVRVLAERHKQVS